ncbi:MAG: acetylxylan esterase [Kiritimatiellae bacterium]|jgi:hypothetical protein|nr:acetylxylan esterase [Kiritimatiellia bacterium]
MHTQTILTFLLLCSLFTNPVIARPPNYDESKVAPYDVPDPLSFANGEKLTSRDQWPQRRQEVLAIFEDQMYGIIPPRPAVMRTELIESGETLNGTVIRKQIRMWFNKENKGPKIDWIFFLPKNVSGAVPAFIGLNFYGNQEILPDKEILVTDGWLRNNKKHFIADNRASEKSRALSAAPEASQSWPVKTLTERGYALVTACYGEIDPDYDDGYTNGVHVLFPPKTRPIPGNYTTSLAAWAWALIRGMDMIEKEKAINSKQVTVIGCSRLAKAALLAGAKDERFAVVIPNQTGGGGTPPAKRDFGENVSFQNKTFPHWFCGNYRKYSDNEEALTFDQHMLLAACAPRRLYVSSFPKGWFDPYGEFLSMKAAEPVWQFLGLPGLPAEKWPEENVPVSSTHLGYHRRPGEHGIAPFDWECYLNFTDRAFKPQTSNLKPQTSHL